MFEIKFTRGIVARLIREQKGLGQHEMDVHKTTISQFELGKRKPDRSTEAAIKDKLGVSLEDIDTLVNVLNTKSKPATAAAFERMDLHEMLDEIVRSNDKGLIYGIEINLRSLSASAKGVDYSPPDEPLEGGGLPVTIDPRTNKPLGRKGRR